MPTAERKRLALEKLVANSANTQNASNVSSYDVSHLGVSIGPTQGSGFVMNAQFQDKFLGLVQNEFLSRGAFIQRWMDPRRDYNKECGYPETSEITSEKWQDYYDRHPIAARVIEIMPTECWQFTPDITEDDDPTNKTPFEQAFSDLATSLRGDSLFKPDEREAHPIWEMCRRADILSGIGQFGVILLGFSDGLSLNQPVKGWEEPNVGEIIWNKEALPFLHSEVSEHISVNNGKLTWNIPSEEEDPKGGVKKKKGKTQIGIKQNDPKRDEALANPQAEEERLPADPSDFKNKSSPSLSAFGNVDPQQSKYRDPLNVDGQNDIKPYKEQQTEGLDKLESKQSSVEGQSNIQPFKDDSKPQDIQEPMPEEGLKLIYLRVFPESLIQIMNYEQNPSNPRFGQPTIYKITLNDPLQKQSGVGLPLSTIEVHYSRVIHIADVGANAGSSEIFAAPRMRPVLNQLIDLQKIYGACGEGYWKNAFATLAAETHPQLGGDVTMDTEAMRNQMKKWRDGLDRVLAATGVTWKTISPQIVDPNSHVQNQIQAICIKLGVPLRVFMGSEQGQLAADQDSRAWFGRVKERRKNYITPRIIVPLVDRLISVGVLPTPTSYGVKWDDDQKLTPQEQAQVAGALTGAMATYISGQVDQFMEPVTYLIEILGWDKKKAQSAIDATLEHIQRQQEQQAQQGSQMMDPSTGQPLEQDESGQFIDPNTGEPLQTDEFGKPVMINPETGEPMPVQQQSAQEAQGPLGAEAAESQGIDPEMGQSIPQEEQPVGEDQVPQAGGQVDEETGLPIDPETGLLIDQQSGYLIDKESGDVTDPKSGQVVGNLFREEDNEQETEIPRKEDQEGFEEDGEEVRVPSEPTEEPPQRQPSEQELQAEQEGVTPPSVPSVDEETGYQIDPESGYLVHPETGYKLDKETGNVYDQEGKYAGNVNEQGEEDASDT